MKRALMFCALAWSALAGAADAPPTFDAGKLKEGRFIYRTTLQGELLGETMLEIRRVGASYRITMSAPEIAQSWQAEVNRAFAPLSASLSMRGKKGAYTMALKYSGAKITGEEREAGDVRPVQAFATGIVVDQRVDWAAMMASNAGAGESIAVQVFDPSTGFSEMRGKVSETPSELRLDYSIRKRDHLEEYTVHATRETPRYMLREDMPNGLVSELIRIEP
jgi:hypothetical protein